MGSCLSKKTSDSNHISQPQSEKKTDISKTPQTDLKRVGLVEEDRIKKEVFVIKHRKSHDISPQEKSGFNSSSSPVSSVSPRICVSNSPAVEIAGVVNVVVPISQPIVRTSSCSKDEVDAILIQCGRLSRSSSGNVKVAASPGKSRNYSGSKRSYDFDNCDNENEKKGELGGADADNRVRPHRQSRGSPSPHGRRRTPSRERDQQRSGSGSRDRVLSRSPARRRLENNNNHSTSSNARPGRIVTVPATVMDKNNNNEGAAAATQGSNVKRVLVKRNVASPRSQSPAKVNNQCNAVEVLNENQDAHLAKPSLSRSSSRKETDQSPFRRRPLNDISSNSNKTTTHVVVSQVVPIAKPTPVEATNNNSKVTELKANNGRVTKHIQENKVVTVIAERAKEEQDHTKPITESTVVENTNHQTLTRSRSSRKSRDLDLEALSNPTNTYASILLQDIQNFHQKSNTANSLYSLPPCLNKACSILEAVADLNSSTGGSDRLSNSPLQQYSISTNYEVSNGTKAKTEFESAGDPFVESEVSAGDDLMAPSLHKYVTMKRGSATAIVADEDREELESSGSNSVGGHQQYWDPKSADSTDRTSTREAAAVPSARRLSAKKRREYEPQQSRIERSRVGGASRGTAAGST